MNSQCKWAFLTTTIKGDLVCTIDEISFDRICPHCGGEVIEIERNFGGKK